MKKSEIANEQPTPRVIALVMLLALLWGGNSVSIKIGLQGIPPLALAGLRFLLGLAAITAWSLSQRIQMRMNRGELLPLVCLSAIFLMQIIALNVGTRFTLASHSTILVTTYPFFTALFAHFWVPGERLTLRKTVGICIAFSGVLLTFAKHLQPGTHDFLLGDLIVLTSGCLLGLRTVVTKRLVQSIHPYRLLVWLMILSLPCFFGLSFFLEKGASYHFSASGVAAICYQGLVVAGFCFVAWTSVLERYSPSKLVVLFFTTPLFGVLLSHLLLGDEISPSLIAGAGFVAGGIYLVNKKAE
ncbi:DMT family transporter [Candidatus Poribacteria bacterium]|nr:DMT family transporter [Candidatus Poribacteria bacterium]